jgi:protein-tyrosine-phosphatase
MINWKPISILPHERIRVITAKGGYIVDGTFIALKNLQTSGDESEALPKMLTMNLVWNDSDSVIAMDKTEAVYLRRRKKGNALSTFMQMTVKRDEATQQVKDSPEVRGVFGEVTRSAQETSDLATGKGEEN